MVILSWEQKAAGQGGGKKFLPKCLQHYLNAFRMALEKLREYSVGQGKKNAVGIAGGWSKSLCAGQLPFGVDQAARGPACLPT